MTSQSVGISKKKKRFNDKTFKTLTAQFFCNPTKKIRKSESIILYDQNFLSFPTFQLLYFLVFHQCKDTDI